MQDFMRKARGRTSKPSAQARICRRLAGTCTERGKKSRWLHVCEQRSGVEREQLGLLSFCTPKENAQAYISL